jgi:hypothetical protein
MAVESSPRHVEGKSGGAPIAARPQAPRPIREASPICVRGSPILIVPGRSAGVKPGADRRGGDVLYVSESQAVLEAVCVLVVAVTVTVTFVLLKVVDQGVTVVSAVLLLYEHWLRSELPIRIMWR